MNRRRTKQKYQTIVEGFRKTGALTDEQAETFLIMFRRCLIEAEFEEVSRAMHGVMQGWKTGGGQYDHLLRAANDLDVFEDSGEDADPPGLVEALARSQIHFKDT